MKFGEINLDKLTQMSEELVFITLCDDANSPLVQPLYSSLRGNLRIIETYSLRLGWLSKIFKVHEFLAADTEYCRQCHHRTYGCL